MTQLGGEMKLGRSGELGIPDNTKKRREQRTTQRNTRIDGHTKIQNGLTDKYSCCLHTALGEQQKTSCRVHNVYFTPERVGAKCADTAEVRRSR